MISEKYKDESIPIITKEKFFRGNEQFFIHLSTDCMEYSSRLHIHEFAEISYIISGKAEHEINGEVYPVIRGDVIAISRNTPHTFRPVSSSEPFVAYDMMFTESFFERGFCLGEDFGEMCATLFYQSCDTSPDIHISGAAVIGELFHRIYTEFCNKRKGYLDLIRAYTAELIIGLFRKIEAEDSGKLSQRLRAAVNNTVSYLEKNFRRHITLEELAARIYFSKDYLNRVFREVVGMPVGAYLQRLRLDEAKRLLLETDSTVLDIAIASGFGDVKSLYTVFKREMHMTPGEYRGE